MTLDEQIMRLSAGRMHLGWFMDWFDQDEKWESYLRCAVLFHAYDELLKKKMKEKNK
jgi:hypothetical protein